MRKKLIEVALPLEAINKASVREKSIRHGHPSTLHLWWARRPLAACRAVIFASLVDDPSDPDAPAPFVEACRRLPDGPNAAAEDTPRARLFDFIEKLVQWESTTDEEVLQTARELIRLSTGGNPPPLLDPFAGGGSIPLEAQRLGLEAHASDLNPVAVMINKALIEIPPRFADRPPVNPQDQQGQIGRIWHGAQGLAADVRYYGAWMRDRAWERIGHLYPPGPNGETVIAWLWARTVKCPNPACGTQMPLVSSFELSRKKGCKAWVEPKIDVATKTVRFEVRTGEGKVPMPPKVGRGAKFRCLVCGEIAPDQYIKNEGMAGRMGVQLMAVVTEGKNGRSYYTAPNDHEQVAAAAIPQWLPTGELADDPRNIWCKQYGLVEFPDLFTARQLVALTTFSDLVSEARAQAYADAAASNLSDDDVPLREGGCGARAYAEAISVYLAFGVDRLADRQSTICGWDAGYTKIRNTFARQAIPMTWDFAEGNPFSDSTGNFLDALGWICEVLEINRATTPGNVGLVDAKKLSFGQYIVLATDPPYYDNISYADLSDFFYIWLKKMLTSIFPELFTTLLTPKEDELIASPYRHNGDAAAANRFFEDGLAQVFTAIHRVAHPDYPLMVYYAFKQSEGLSADRGSTGWEVMLESLADSGFVIDGSWPMRTELSNRPVASGTNALASSVVLVCRPRPDDAPMISRQQFVQQLHVELPAVLRELQSGNVAPVDLAQAVIGPGMAVFSRYRRVLEPNGKALSVRDALQLINQELDALLARQESDVDQDTRFAIAWFEQFGYNEAEFGVADVLARAKNTSVDGLVQAGIAEAGGGRVRLKHWRELDAGAWDPATDRRPTVWEGTHYLIERLASHAESGAAELLAKMSSALAAEARGLAYRLYSVCDRKGWAEYARDYNALVVSWPRLQELAQEARQGGFEQLSLL